MKRKKHGVIAWTMRYHNIINVLAIVFMIIGVVALIKMPRNEFPQFTIRQGLIIGVFPGATSAEVEEQLTKPVENYIFGYKEIKKAKTYSESKEGMMIIYVELNDNVVDADAFWSKMKHGLNEYKSSLPSGVLALVANSDFGDTSAMLITLSSDTKSYKEMESELKRLKAACRKINAVSKIKDYGIQREKIYVNVQPEKLNEYNIKSLSLLSSYQFNGMVAPAGQLKMSDNYLNVHFPPNFESEKDLESQIVFSDPKGGVVRLKDISTIERRNEDANSYITQNGKKTILLSLEMQPGNNIVEFGNQVQKVLAEFKEHSPKDIEVNVISNLPKYVDDSITNFMHEFLIAIIAVVLVVMLLLPKRVAAIAGFTVPISVLITLAMLYFFGVELNTVSLAGLIIVLGMIVDNSIVVIDNYVEKKDHGMSSWHAAIKSARELVTPIITATLAICTVYIPLGIMLPGTAGDFVRILPTTVVTALVVSILVALFVVPFLNFRFIKSGLKLNNVTKNSSSFLEKMQSVFDKILEKTFRHPKVVIALCVTVVVASLLLFFAIDQQLFPTVERNQFAVEVYLDKGASLESTANIVNKLSDELRKDKRVTTVTNFVGTGSPRFHTVYAPNLPGANYGQLMVNTIDNKATVAVCEEYDKKYRDAFPNAHVKWRILALQLNKYPIEIRISGDSIHDLRKVEAQIDSIFRPKQGVIWIHSDWGPKQQNVRVELDKDKASRMGYSKSLVATSLMVGLNGLPLTTVWESDYPVSVELVQDGGKQKNINYIGNQTITSPLSFSAIPLRSFTTLSPEWTEGTIVHRNGTRTLTVQVDLASNAVASNVMEQIKPQIESLHLPDGVTIGYGGEIEGQEEAFQPMTKALIVSILIIFFILLIQFKKIKSALLIMSTMILAIPGAAIGLFLIHYPFSLTAFIGITSLCGIVVRNGIILVDYLEELRHVHGMGVKEAALAAGKRRMRPIFLTSAAASVGVIPMIMSGSSLWGPLGTVICFGLLISMVLTLLVLPVLYTIIYKDKGPRKKKAMPYSNIVKEFPVVLLCVFMGLGTSSTLNAQSKILTVDSCKSLALRNNLKIKDAEIEIKASKEVKKSAFANYFPKVSAMALAMRSSDYLIKGTIPSMNLPVYDGNPANLATATQFAYVPEIPINVLDYMNMASVTVIQPIFTGGRIYNGNKLAEIGKKVSEQKKELTVTQIIFRTEELYWSVVSLNEKMNTVLEYEKFLNQLNADVTVAVKAGLAQRNDLYRVQLKQNELSVNKLKLVNGIQMATMALCQHIGVSYDSTYQVKNILDPVELPVKYYDHSGASVVNARIETQMLNTAVEAEKLQKKMAVGEYLPQLSLGGMGFSTKAMDKVNSNVMAFATVSVPISDWWGGSHKIKESQFKIDRATTRLHETKELLELQAQQTKNELNETYAQIQTSQNSIEQSKENLRIVSDNFKAGVSSVSDLLEAQAMHQQAKTDYSDAVCTYHLKIAAYLQATGNYR